MFSVFGVSKFLSVSVVGCVYRSKMAVFCVCVSIASPSLSLLTGEDMVSKGSGVYVAAVSD